MRRRLTLHFVFFLSVCLRLKVYCCFCTGQVALGSVLREMDVFGHSAVSKSITSRQKIGFKVIFWSIQTIIYLKSSSNTRAYKLSYVLSLFNLLAKGLSMILDCDDAPLAPAPGLTPTGTMLQYCSTFCLLVSKRPVHEFRSQPQWRPASSHPWPDRNKDESSALFHPFLTCQQKASSWI